LLLPSDSSVGVLKKNEPAAFKECPTTPSTDKTASPFVIAPDKTLVAAGAGSESGTGSIERTNMVADDKSEASTLKVL
jgi:hypothetical protein